MRVTLLLADEAEKDESKNKINARGIGWDVTSSPTSPMALCIFFDVPWDETDIEHTVVIDFLDADGRQVLLGTDGAAPTPAFEAEGRFTAERPPELPPGTPIRDCQVVNLPPGMPLAPGEKYEFRVSINGIPMESSLATFTVSDD